MNYEEERIKPGDFARVLGELQALRRETNRLFWLIIALIMWMTALTFGADSNDAVRDRAALPQHLQQYMLYFGTDHLPEDQRLPTLRALYFTIASTTRNVVISQQKPHRITDSLVRIDMRYLGWHATVPALLEKHYPYGTPHAVHADWFVAAALDQADGIDIYHTLLFGKKLKTVDEFHQLVGAQMKSPFTYGWIEDESGVSLARTRQLLTFPTAGRTDMWQSYDSAIINEQSDPLEHLTGDFTYDANELIYLLPKTHRGSTGHLQAYLLCNAAGEVQTKAPASIVVDRTQVRGVELSAALSCVTCHTQGLKYPVKDAFKEYLASGAEVYASYQDQQAIETRLLTDLTKLIDRANEDYEATIQAINGLTAPQNAANIKQVVQSFDAPLSRTDAARELGLDDQELVDLLAQAIGLPARLASLAHGQPISRTAWESAYTNLEAVRDGNPNYAAISSTHADVKQ